MKTIGFGERQRFAQKASQPLAQGVEPTLNMVRFAAVFANRLMPICRANEWVSIPEITERKTPFVTRWDAPPKVQATGFTPVTNEICDNLACTATQRHPNPPLVGLLEHKGPQFIQFQHIIQLSGSQWGVQRRQVVSPLFDPTGNRAPRNAKQPLNAPQADAVEYRTSDLGTGTLVMATLSVQRAIAITVMAIIFLCAFIIVSVSYHVLAAAFWARMRYNRLYHEKVLQMDLVVYSGLPFHASSVKTSPLLVSHTRS
jgi:hypothetical protein